MNLQWKLFFNFRLCTSIIMDNYLVKFLCVNRTSRNNVVLGDYGRYPIYIESVKRCKKYWSKLLTLPNDRYVEIYYKMLLSTTCAKYFNWANEMHMMYDDIDFISCFPVFYCNISDDYIPINH
jgi:hypothetical protein